MTNKPKSCAQINEEVALHLEWTCVNGWWFPSGGDTRHSGKPYLPDFCGEWQHAGPLQAMLADVGVVRLLKIENTDKYDGCWMCGVSIKNPETLKVTRNNSDGQLPTEAITRAFHAAFVERKECKNMD